MKPLMLVGIILIVLGALGVIFGGISYTKNTENADLGPLSVEVEEKERLSIHPALGAVVLVGGLVVTGVAAKRKR